MLIHKTIRLGPALTRLHNANHAFHPDFSSFPDYAGAAIIDWFVSLV